MDTSVRPPWLAIALASLSCACQQAPEIVRSDVGDAERCQSVELWPERSTDLEDDLIDVVNIARAEGRECKLPDDAPEDATPAGGQPVLTVEVVPEMRCAARWHAHDQVSNGFVGHAGDDGSTPFERLQLSGYTGVPRHELIGADFVQIRDVVDAWLADPQHCAALMHPKIEDVGAGHRRSSKGDQIAWVLLTGERRED